MARLLPLLLLICGCATYPVTHGIPNFATVDPGIVRGGQPTAEGFMWLRANGYTNIIKLNPESEGTDAAAKSLGMTVYYIPIDSLQQVFGPVHVQLYTALAHVKEGTFWHCSRGSNRSGTLGILYRIRVDHWTKAQAITEADLLGWGTSLPALKDFVEDL